MHDALHEPHGKKAMTVRQFAMLGVFLITAAMVTALYLVIPAAPGLAPGAKYSPITGEVDAGFVGIVNFGHWRLICDPASDKLRARQENICRVNQEVSIKDRPNEVILAANLRVLGSAQHAVLALRLPPTARVGDKILLRFGGYVLKVPVHECSAAQCLARTELNTDGWGELLDAAAIEAVLPASQDRRALVDIPVDGLAQAAAAMNKAQGL